MSNVFIASCCFDEIAIHINIEMPSLIFVGMRKNRCLFLLKLNKSHDIIIT